MSTKKWLLAGILASPFALANVVHAAGKGELTPKDLCAGLAIHEEVWHMEGVRIERRLGPIDVFRFGAGGERARNKDEPKDYICRMGNHSSHNYGDEWGAIHVGLEVKVLADGRMTMAVAQYKETQRGKNRAQFDKPLRSEDFDISDLKTVQWKAESSVGKKLMIRLLPIMGVDGAPKEAKEFAVAGKDTIIFDDRQNVWIDNITFGAPYVALTTQQGTIALSFNRFEGADQMGDAKGRRLELRLLDGRLLTFLSQSDFVPAGERYLIFGKHWPEKKSEGPGNIGSSESTTREDFERRIRKLN